MDEDEGQDQRGGRDGPAETDAGGAERGRRRGRYRLPRLGGRFKYIYSLVFMTSMKVFIKKKTCSFSYCHFPKKWTRNTYDNNDNIYQLFGFSLNCDDSQLYRASKSSERPLSLRFDVAALPP